MNTDSVKRALTHHTKGGVSHWWHAPAANPSRPWNVVLRRAHQQRTSYSDDEIQVLLEGLAAGEMAGRRESTSLVGQQTAVQNTRPAWKGRT